ncbi:hypothetical protein PV08_03644 [Exophiala spinifera]|uniref:Uncharacterized protein n=1 Tax=Exophiala spinifera TaxID=91928 RepID=A0A0D2C6Z4_9EURO|nr:uncharacterized protein PV08_03644 [Exophiala spinifera]KIW19349.1 hypothetical protein PV08_03644 [Exophiala spinifera]
MSLVWHEPNPLCSQDDRRHETSYYPSPPQDRTYTLARGNDSSRATDRYHWDSSRRDAGETGSRMTNPSNTFPVRSRNYPYETERQQYEELAPENRSSTHGEAARRRYTSSTRSSDDRSKTRAPYDERLRGEDLTTGSRQSRTVQTSNASSTTDSGAAAFGLRGDILEFVNIPLGRFASMRDFIDSHPNILRANLQTLLEAASRAKSANNITVAKRCIQRIVLIRACKDEALARDRYFQKLTRQDSSEFKKFHQACDHLEERLDSETQPRQETQATNTGYPASAQYSYQTTRPPTSFPASASTSTRPSLDRYDSRNSTQAFRQQQDTVDDMEDPEDPEDPGSNDRLPQTTGTFYSMRPDTNPTQRERGLSVRRRQNQYPPTADGGRNAQFRTDNTADAEPGTSRLDSRYKLRTGRDCRSFFVAGRVISIIHYSSMGAQSPSSQTPILDQYGDPIHSGPRRMIIVQPRQGYSVCVPISSHGRRGIGSKKLNQREQQAHAIVYPEGTEVPSSLDGEPEFEKQPIAVRLCGDQTLNQFSRIHFGKYHTVEHNVKVMDVGRVSKESMPAFDAYCRQELLRG